MADREPSALDLWRLSGRHAGWYSLPSFPSWMKNPAIGYSAKHFALDEQSWAYVSETARTQVSLIRELAEFAIPPYETVVLTLPMPSEQDFPSADLVLFVRSPADFVGFIHHTDGREDDWTAIPFMHVQQSDAEANKTVAVWILMVTAFFLLLHARRVVTVAEVPARRTLRRGKAVTYYSYSKVKIDLTAPKLTRRLFASGTHATPRRHEVMGHFVHRGGLRHGCTHDWQPIVRDPDDHIPRWECSSCERKRTWRKAFERGDASKGFVRQEYAITAKETGRATHPEENH